MDQNSPVVNPKAGQGLNITGLVLGILGIILALTPCTFFFAVPLAVIGLILSILGYSQASKGGAPKGMGTAAIVLCGLAIVVCAIWGYAIYKAKNDPKLQQGIRDFKTTMDSIKDANK